jgi:1,4-alpha-glucan branching enzyme
MQQVTNDTATRMPWKLHIAEDLLGNPWLVKDVDSGGAGFGSQWDADFVHPVRRVMIAQQDHERDMGDLRHAIEHRYGSDGLARVIYSESHDEVANGRARLPEDIWPGNAGGWHARKRSTLAAALVFTSPGIPMLFQGQEVLEDAWFRDDDPIDWTREQTYAGIVALYRDLIRLRRDWYGTTRGLRGHHVGVHHVNDDDKVVAFHRWDRGGPSDDVVVVVNCSSEAFATYRVGFPRPGTWRVRMNTDWSGYGEDFGAVHSHDPVAGGAGADGMAWAGDVAIGPYSALILSQDP